MTTYLVTGGAGFIGSNYINYMLQKYGSEIRIINMDKLTYAGSLYNLRETEGRGNYRFIQADICSLPALRSVFLQEEIHRVVHFAAESHVDRSIDSPGVFVDTNVSGTLNLLLAAREAWETEDGVYLPGRRFLQISTDEVYGSLGMEEDFFTEESPYRPRSPYAASKAAGDHLVRAYMNTYDFPANITNCSNNYGPGQHPEKLIPMVIRNALEGKEIPIYGDGRNIRDWLYVEDHVKALDMVLKKGEPFETYNIGGLNERQNIEMIRMLLDILKASLPDSDPRRANIGEQLLTYVEDRKGHDRRYAVSSDKLFKQTGWRPETDFAEGMNRTVRWYLDNPRFIEEDRR